jgi:hypothetical protein
MSAKNQPAPAYEAEREYDVRLTRVLWLGSVKLLPRDPHVMRGDVLNDREQVPPEAVAEAIPRQERIKSPEAEAALAETAAKVGGEVVISDAQA